MKIISTIKNEFAESHKVLENFMADDNNFTLIEQAATMMAQSIQSGGKIISCGNGGSHCDAMHFAEELTGRYRNSRAPLPALAISDPSYLSCVGNDFGYPEVFSRFIEAFGRAGDTLLAISTSGQSESIIKAVQAAKSKSMKIVILTGNDGGKLRGSGDVEIIVPHYGFADRI
ncbi:MAG TPA: SIS domain-containing protein, partial [Mucilaginibacter sp.]